MDVAESLRGRSLVVQLGVGDELLASLRTVCKRHEVTAAWVEGVGSFSEMSLAAGAEAPLMQIGTVERVLVSGLVLNGQGEPHVGLDAWLTEGNGVRTGRVVRASCRLAQLRWTVWDDLALVSDRQEASGLVGWRLADRAASPILDGRALGSSWAAVVSASAEAQRPDVPRVATSRPDLSWPRQEARARPSRPALPTPVRAPLPKDPLPSKKRGAPGEEDPIPQAGEYLSHKQFGLCRVDGEDAEGGTIVRLPSGLRRTLRLEVMQVTGPRTDEEGRSVYDVRPRPKS